MADSLLNIGKSDGVIFSVSLSCPKQKAYNAMLEVFLKSFRGVANMNQDRRLSFKANQVPGFFQHFFFLPCFYALKYITFHSKKM